MVRRRVEIKKIEDNNKRQVTFTKRRQGLFKKANELCKKCDCQIAVMAVSAAGNLFAFGNPTFDSIVQRYLDVKAVEAAGGPSSPPETSASAVLQEEEPEEMEEEPSDEEDDEDRSLSLSLAPLQQEKEKEGENSKVEDKALWDIPVDGMSLEELQKLNARMEEMNKRVVDRANEIIRSRAVNN